MNHMPDNPPDWERIAKEVTRSAERKTVSMKIVRDTLSAVLHQLDVGEASDIIDPKMYDSDGNPRYDVERAHKDLRWCRKQLRELTRWLDKMVGGE